jgi:hypothetical protein
MPTDPPNASHHDSPHPQPREERAERDDHARVRGRVEANRGEDGRRVDDGQRGVHRGGERERDVQHRVCSRHPANRRVRGHRRAQVRGGEEQHDAEREDDGRDALERRDEHRDMLGHPFSFACKIGAERGRLTTMGMPYTSSSSCRALTRASRSSSSSSISSVMSAIPPGLAVSMPLRLRSSA